MSLSWTSGRNVWDCVKLDESFAALDDNIAPHEWDALHKRADE